jgi:hypothetical protein
VADVYERARPEYPAEAVDWIATEARSSARPNRPRPRRRYRQADARIDPHRRSSDRGRTGRRDAGRAGTGGALGRRAARLGRGDSARRQHGGCDHVGQAFHWFRHDEAIPELHRVLRRGRSIALVWNSRDHDAPLHQEVGELIAPFVPADRPPAEQWPLALEESPLFGALEERRFPFTETLDADALAERIASVSFVAAAPAEARQQLDAELRAVAARLGGFVDFSYVTRVYVSRAA